MSVEALQGLAQVAAQIQEQSLLPLATQNPGINAVSTPSGFGNMVTQGLGQVNQQLMQSQTDLQQLAVGNVENLHQIMIRLEESRMNFQLVMQVRNRLLEAYQDVMKMPV